jgi:hypothetical protein
MNSRFDSPVGGEQHVTAWAEEGGDPVQGLKRAGQADDPTDRAVAWKVIEHFIGEVGAAERGQHVRRSPKEHHRFVPIPQFREQEPPRDG